MHLPPRSHPPKPLTLETCEALRFWFEPDELTGLICWCDRPHLIVPEDPTKKRLRDLGPGDVVFVKGERLVISKVEPFR